MSPLKKSAGLKNGANNINNFLNRAKHVQNFNRQLRNQENEHDYGNNNNDKMYYVNTQGLNHSQIYPPTKKINFNGPRLDYLIQNQPTERLNSSYDSNRSASRLDILMQKKAKNILRRNIIGRYKRSPYLKGFQNL